MKIVLSLYPAQRSLRAVLLFLLLSCIGGVPSLLAQQVLNGSLVVEGESRSYSLYIPSGYNSSHPNALMLALHPQNLERWNARSWCDTLTAFAEANGLILLCPDGGPDGSIINERRDTLLATMLLDSVAVWYRVDSKRVYAMGFSVGGLATYLYGLANTDRFAGYLPIGAAINKTNEIGPLLPAVAGKPVYVVHGGADAAPIRYYPAVNALQDNGAILQSLLMPGVAHTIDFPKRNAILTTAFRWIDSVNLAGMVSGVDDAIQEQKERYRAGNNLFLYPNPIPRDGEGTLVRLMGSFASGVRVIDVLGTIRSDVDITFVDGTSAKILPRNLSPGVYFLQVDAEGERQVLRFVVR